MTDPRKAGETKRLEGAAGQVEPPVPAPTAVAAGGRLVCLTDGREYQINVTPFVLGRDAGAGVVITSPDASRRHAQIVSGPEGDVVVDLSSNGTFVNGQRVSRQELKALDTIRIGAEEFRYYPAAKQPAPAATPPPGAEFRLGDTLVGVPRLRTGLSSVSPAASTPPTTLASLLVKKGERKGDRLTIRGPVANVGRADFNDLHLPDASVSSSHAKLQLRTGGWVISDLGSTNGTFVDEVRVGDETPLSPGCVLRLGDVHLLFEPVDEGIPAVLGTPALPKTGPTTGEAPPPATGRAAMVAVPPPAPGPARPAGGSPPATRRHYRVGIAVLLLLAILVALILLF